jgi:quinol monooxygenase YgiN
MPISVLARIIVCSLLLVVAAQAARAADESVTLIGRFYASPGREAEVEARFLQLVAFVRKAEPNITYRLHRSIKDPSVFVFYEVFPSQAARDEHTNIHIPAFQKEFGATAEGLFARPPEREFFRALAD